MLEWFADKHNQKVVADLLAQITIETIAPKTTKQIFEGKIFVLTGTMPTLARDEAKNMIIDRGGKVSGSVSKNTDYVLLGENAGSKFDEAQKLGIKTLSETEFLKLLT